MTTPARNGGDGVSHPGARESASPVRSLRQAVVTAVALIAIVAVCYAGGPTWFFWLAAAAVMTALAELLVAVAGSGRRPVVPFALACGFGAMIVAYFAPARPGWLLGIGGAAVWGSFVLALRRERGTSPASDVAWTVLGLAWIGGAGAAAASMLTLPDGLNLLVAHVAIAAVDDIGAYFAGTRFGRRRLAPSLSPAKSWEGAIAGGALAIVAGSVAGLLIELLGPLHGAAIGAIVSLFAPAGDLVESMAKRELGVKDSGTILPGHGGFLDRVDAILFCVPPVLLYLHLAVL